MHSHEPRIILAPVLLLYAKRVREVARHRKLALYSLPFKLRPASANSGSLEKKLF